MRCLVCCYWVWTGRPVGWVQHIPGLTALAATRQLIVHPTHLPLSSSFSSFIYLYCPPFFLLYKPTISSLHSFKQQFQYSIAFMTSFSVLNILKHHFLTSQHSLISFYSLSKCYNCIILVYILSRVYNFKTSQHSITICSFLNLCSLYNLILYALKSLSF